MAITPITPQEYQKLAERTECNQEKAAVRYREEADWFIRVDHAQKGLSGEVGEIAGALERYIHYGQEPLDIPNIKEELGDVLWYVALMCNALGFDLGDVMECNIHKLKKRYPDKYSDFQALEENRDREAERAAMTKGMTKDDPEGQEITECCSGVPWSDLCCVGDVRAPTSYIVSGDLPPTLPEEVEAAVRKSRAEDDGVYYEGPSAPFLKSTVSASPLPMGVPEYGERMVGHYNTIAARKLSKLHKWGCDNCGNPVSDEPVRELLSGDRETVRCPQCNHETRSPKILG